MSETSTSASVSIAEAMSSTVSRLNYRLVVTTDGGEPAGGEEIVISKTGDGSFAPNFRSDEIRRVTDASGEAIFTWYRGGVFTRGVKATVSASPLNAGLSVKIEPVTEPLPDVTISYIERPIRIRPQ